jgi:hypothetical protein
LTSHTILSMLFATRSSQMEAEYHNHTLKLWQILQNSKKAYLSRSYRRKIYKSMPNCQSMKLTHLSQKKAMRNSIKDWRILLINWWVLTLKQIKKACLREYTMKNLAEIKLNSLKELLRQMRSTMKTALFTLNWH